MRARDDDPGEFPATVAARRLWAAYAAHRTLLLGAAGIDLAITPETYCHRCGGPNVVWSAPSPLWNEVMRGGDVNGLELHDGIVCPTCFVVIAEAAGTASMWRLSAGRVHRPLQTVTPSGRVWNVQAWMWEDPGTNPIIIAPQITADVYAAARDASDEDQEVGDRLACATEATWARAYRAGYAVGDARAAEMEARYDSLTLDLARVAAARDEAAAEANAALGDVRRLTAERDALARLFDGEGNVTATTCGATDSRGRGVCALDAGHGGVFHRQPEPGGGVLMWLRDRAESTPAELHRRCNDAHEDTTCGLHPGHGGHLHVEWVPDGVGRTWPTRPSTPKPEMEGRDERTPDDPPHL